MSAPAVAVARDGERFWVAWKQVTRGPAQVSWRRCDDGPEGPVREAAGVERNHPAMALGPDGVPWVCWEERSGTGQSVWLRSLRPSDPGIRLSVADDSVAAFPVLAIAGGRVWVAWEERRGAESRVWATSVPLR